MSHMRGEVLVLSRAGFGVPGLNKDRAPAPEPTDQKDVLHHEPAYRHLGRRGPRHPRYHRLREPLRHHPSTGRDPASTAPAETSPSVEPSTPAAPEPSEQSLTEACLEPNTKLIEASAELTKVSAALAASDGKDAQAVVDALKEMGNYFTTMAESAVNPEVKDALTGIAKGYADLAKAYGKLLIDNDLTAGADAMKALTGLQESMDAFTKLCTGS